MSRKKRVMRKYLKLAKKIRKSNHEEISDREDKDMEFIKDAISKLEILLKK